MQKLLSFDENVVIIYRPIRGISISTYLYIRWSTKIYMLISGDHCPSHPYRATVTCPPKKVIIPPELFSLPVLWYSWLLSMISS